MQPGGVWRAGHASHGLVSLQQVLWYAPLRCGLSINATWPSAYAAGLRSPVYMDVWPPRVCVEESSTGFGLLSPFWRWVTVSAIEGKLSVKLSACSGWLEKWGLFVDENLVLVLDWHKLFRSWQVFGCVLRIRYEFGLTMVRRSDQRTNLIPSFIWTISLSKRQLCNAKLPAAL